jgi:putative Mn2+ efflux pump MntP
VFFSEILLIAVGLSMDSFAVSLACGASYNKLRWPLVMRAVLFFGLFQGAFAGLGWFMSQSFKELIEQFDHWVAFILLLGIGGKMIWESFGNKPGDRSFNIENYLILLGLSVATSIDALIVGMGLGFLESPVFISVILIAVVTVLFSLTGFFLSVKNGFRMLGNRGELVGGLILIGIGFKVLIQHL